MDENNVESTLPETPLVTKEITTLEHINTELSTDTNNVNNARIVSPTDVVEQKLSDFVTDAFKATNKDLAFNEKLKDEITARLPKLTDNQIIALFSNTNVNINDKISKLIGPTFQLMTATKNAEIVENAKVKQAAANQVIVNTGSTQPNDIGNNKEDTRDVIQGFNILSNLLNAVSTTSGDQSGEVDDPNRNSHPTTPSQS